MSFDLERFVEARRPAMAAVFDELREGRKRTHWMWFVFPQIAGLGHSDMARRFAISSIGEARAFLAHPVLGTELRECCRLVNAVEGRTALEIFGQPDDMKFRSSMTLFDRASDGDAVFREALGKYFGGAPDPRTIERLEGRGAD